ncbi:tripartite tricarboxylate transporter TctB family protein [Jiella mangrovi]|uniref:Tripartite tricarboxylate transporter TctB family protein n=1 Tax=Jiella mangrovi TaxID=2821407 RepID=A0ABS4BLZ9_9HYPH|nr:tripartite tricarboxylate transporter TctB family protein [Jiella mangrovi]MBP0617209.1 tripartite tricarboxylate transporter TctB family protein [Jiella mangrovi]
MKFNDLLLGLLVLVAGVAIYVSALGFTDIPGQAYGAGTMPRAIALFAVCLGLSMIGRAVVAGARMPRLELAPWVRAPRPVVSALVAIALVVFYIAAAPAIGFVPASLVVMAVLMLTLRTRPVTAIAVSIAACVVIQQAFGRLLLVPLPRSEFLGFLW